MHGSLVQPRFKTNETRLLSILALSTDVERSTLPENCGTFFFKQKIHMNQNFASFCRDLWTCTTLIVNSFYRVSSREPFVNGTNKLSIQQRYSSACRVCWQENPQRYQGPSHDSFLNCISSGYYGEQIQREETIELVCLEIQWW